VWYRYIIASGGGSSSVTPSEYMYWLSLILIHSGYLPHVKPNEIRFLESMRSLGEKTKIAA